VSANRLAYATKSVRALWAGNQSVSPNAAAAARVLRQRAEIGAAVTKDMANAGVGILAGCDTMIAGFCVHDELAAMVRGGMTPIAALQTATINPARYFGLQETTGSVASGRRADLVLLDANPLTDITNVGRIRAVLVGGRLLDRTELDNVLGEVKAAANQN
jgi:imidazolonepropionase-like amidohydrolase